MGGSSTPSPPAAVTGRGIDDIAYFQSIPWCAAHLAAATAASPDGTLVLVPVFSRAPKPNYDDALLSTTLKTPDTIPAFVCFYPGPEDRAAYLPQVQVLVSLGALVAGFGGMSHGGIIATVFDEALSLLMPGARWVGWKKPGVVGGVTAYLHTHYLKRVAVPGTYLVTVRLVKKEGRKVFVEGFMEDKHGAKLARAEALFIEMKEKL